MDAEILTRRAEIARAIYLAIAGGGHVYFCHDAAALAAATSVVRPTRFFGVPRVWEKIQAAIKGGLAAEQDPARRAAVGRAMDVGRRYIEGTQMGRAVPAELAEAFRQADAQVLQPIRALAGLGAVANGTSAAAPLPADVATFFASLGLAILDRPARHRGPADRERRDRPGPLLRRPAPVRRRPAHAGRPRGPRLGPGVRAL